MKYKIIKRAGRKKTFTDIEQIKTWFNAYAEGKVTEEDIKNFWTSKCCRGLNVKI